jgi:hypothetical protein
MAAERRQRADGTWTFTDAAWDAKWYWPIGTRVQLANGATGTVSKANSTTVSVATDDGRVRSLVPMRGLIRL